jgi:hypothetical protein
MIARGHWPANHTHTARNPNRLSHRQSAPVMKAQGNPHVCGDATNPPPAEPDPVEAAGAETPQEGQPSSNHIINTG